MPPYLLNQGAKKYILAQNPSWTDDQSAWVSAACAGGVGLITIAVVLPILRWYHGAKFTAGWVGGRVGGCTQHHDPPTCMNRHTQVRIFVRLDGTYLCPSSLIRPWMTFNLFFQGGNRRGSSNSRRR